LGKNKQSICDKSNAEKVLLSRFRNSETQSVRELENESSRAVSVLI